MEIQRISNVDILGYTTKYIHKDTSETSIKTNLSCQYKPTQDGVILNSQDNNKYSLVISCSVGCPMACTFCHLTEKGVKHQRLTKEEVLQNLIDVVETEAKELTKIGVNLGQKYVKLCWMGMGEPTFELPLIEYVTFHFLRYVFDNNLCCGVDGVDISTVLPANLTARQRDDLMCIQTTVGRYPRNPMTQAKGNTPLRIFYSLHSANEKRETLIPKTKNGHEALRDLNCLCALMGNDLIVHYMFIENVNDSEKDVSDLLDLMNSLPYYKRELRILRYNPSGTEKAESAHFNDIVKRLAEEYPKTKLQYSAGQEILAACGQFL